MEVLNDLLNYNNLKIYQDSDWFNFSLDSVLLANFVKVNNNMKIIDFCTGNAPIPLFLSTKTSSKIIGIELQEEIFSLAKKSVEINDLNNQIILLKEDVKNVTNLYETDSFDLITCNPPYFKVTDKKNINENDVKAKARHELNLNLDDIFKCARKILKNNGKIVMVHRTQRMIEIICLMKKYNLEPKRIQFIYSFNDSKSNMFLIEASKNGNPGLTIEKNLIIHNNNGEYTEEIKKVFNGG